MDRKKKKGKSPMEKQKNGGERRTLRKPSKAALAIVAGLVILALAVTVPLLMRRHDRDIRKYSGAPTDDHEQMNFDVSALGEYSDGGIDLHPDGTYSHRILLGENVDLWLWRDRERPKLPLKERIGEKYPDFRGFKERKHDGTSEYIAEKCVFDSGGKTHTAALIRRSGWDYLLDFSADPKQSAKYADYIDRVLDGIFFL